MNKTNGKINDIQSLKDNGTIKVEGKTIGHFEEGAYDSDMPKYGLDQIKREKSPWPPPDQFS